VVTQRVPTDLVGVVDTADLRDKLLGGHDLRVDQGAVGLQLILPIGIVVAIDSAGTDRAGCNELIQGKILYRNHGLAIGLALTFIMIVIHVGSSFPF
jgi:hypothetical protein